MKLDDIRQRIDTLDSELLHLLQERMELCIQSRRLKKSIEDPAREKSVLASVSSAAPDLLSPSFATTLFGSIMTESKRLQGSTAPLVGFQGERGAYSEIAARELAPSATPIACREFEHVFCLIEQGLLDCGVVPVRNSLEGPVTPVSDLLSSTHLRVTGETTLPIHHCLLAPRGTALEEIHHVYSHPQALAQCRGFLSRHNLEPHPFHDTAGAARMVSRDHPRASAAIAGRQAATLYNLNVISLDIEDDSTNTTHFLLMTRHHE